MSPTIPESIQQTRQQLQQSVEEFLKSGNRIVEVPIGVGMGWEVLPSSSKEGREQTYKAVMAGKLSA